MSLTYNERRILRYIRHYPEWVANIETISTVRAITYDSDRVQSSPSDTMLDMALKIEEWQERIDAVERCLNRTFKTDTRISQMRRACCYGEHVKMRRQKFFRMRKALAAELVREFDEMRGVNRNGKDRTIQRFNAEFQALRNT